MNKYDPLHVHLIDKTKVSELLKKQRESIIKEISKLPKKEEGDGWEEFFKRKGVRVCCPGDDIADGYNLAIKDIIKKLRGK